MTGPRRGTLSLRWRMQRKRRPGASRNWWTTLGGLRARSPKPKGALCDVLGLKAVLSLFVGRKSNPKTRPYMPAPLRCEVDLAAVWSYYNTAQKGRSMCRATGTRVIGARCGGSPWREDQRVWASLIRSSRLVVGLLLAHLHRNTSVTLIAGKLPRPVSLPPGVREGRALERGV